MTKRITFILLIGVVVVILIVLTAGFVFSCTITQKTNDYPVVVSLGDSYSSGEGAPPFYGQNEQDFQTKVDNDDWIAHRSEVSWPGKLEVTNGSKRVALSTLKESKWFFKAASGATTTNLTAPQEIAYNSGSKLFSEGISGTRSLPAQLDVFDGLEPNSVDYVTISIGGNDVGFVSIIKQAAMEFETLGHVTLAERLQEKLDGFENSLDSDCLSQRLARAYREISVRAGSQAHIIIVGYPTLFDESTSTGLISESEARTINDAVRELDNKMAALCEELGRDMNKFGFTVQNLHYVSVLSEFSGHESEYINEIIIGAQDQDVDQTKKVSNYSVHPTEAGTSAYARVVQQVLDELEQQRLASE